MSETNSTETARTGIEQAEAGDTTGANELDQARRENPPAVESVEQEASDGPEGRGLDR